MSNDLMVKQNNELSMMLDERSLKVATILSKSTLVPTQFKNNPGNCLLALNFAARSGADPLLVMQGIYMIHNKPSLETKLLIAMFNSSGNFSPLEYIYNKDKTECYCTAMQLTLKKKLVGPTISIEMAKKEGWYGKTGSKWQTMPEVMLGYRAAAFFIRRYSPETTMGMHTKDEMIDIQMSKKKNVYTAVQEEIDENANKKLIDFPKPELTANGTGFDSKATDDIIESTPDYDPTQNMISIDQAKKIADLRKKLNLTKEQIINSISDFLGRDISRLNDVYETEANEFIAALEMELENDTDIENDDSESMDEPAWGV